MELNALLAQPVALPSLPRAVALLMSELAHAEPSLRRLNQLFGTETIDKQHFTAFSQAHSTAARAISNFARHKARTTFQKPCNSPSSSRAEKP